MEKSFSESYKQAGVDITAGYRAVELMKKHIARTVTAGAASDIGGFGGLFELDLTGMTRPVLVSGTDGVGTKLKYAFMLQKHDTIGIDCVAMCVNDVICCGAKPLFFLDYIACGKNVPERIAAIVSGVAEGCVRAGAALIGGETAEMPGFYPEDEYDLAGFAVGVVDRSKVLDNSKVQAGDVVIALPSSGVHSNGFSLVRKIFEGKDMTSPVAELGGKSLGEALLTPTKIYVKPMLALFDAVTVKAVSHITGGGFYENIHRPLRGRSDHRMSEERKVVVAVLVSGGGTNLQAILDAEKRGELPHARVGIVVSSRPDAYALKRAEEAGVPTAVAERKKCTSQEEFEGEIERAIESVGAEVIVLAGFMSILSENFTSRYPERIINVHPSLIPKFCGKGFYGLKVHEAVLAAGEKVTGATVHYVNEIPDGGRIIFQKEVAVREDDTPETLQRRVMEEAEWKLLPRAVELTAERIASENFAK